VVGSRQRGRIVGAVAAHRDQPSAFLLLANKRELVFGSSFGKKVVDPCLGRDRCRRQRIVAGDHHRADPHPAKFGESLTHSGLDDVFQVQHAKQLAILGHRRRAPVK